MYKLLICLAISTTLIVSCSTEPETKETKGQLTILHLDGSSFEIGQQHGTAMKKEIREIIDRWVKIIEEQSNIPFHEARDTFLTKTEYVDYIKIHAPGILDEIRGIAKGAGLEYKTILAFQMGEEMDVFYNKRSKKCTAISISKKDDCPTIVAQNMDPPQHLHGHPTLLHFCNKNSPEKFVYTVPGLIGLNGLNQNGIAITCNSISMLNSQNRGMPVAFVVRKVLEQETGENAFDFIKTVKHAIPQSYIIGCVQQAKCFECSSNQVKEYKTFEEQGIVAHSNFSIMNRDFNQQFIELLAHYGKSVDDPYFCPRFFLAYDEIVNRNYNLNEDSVAAILSLNKPKVEPISNTDTYGSLIMTLDNEPHLLIAPGQPDKTKYIKLKF